MNELEIFGEELVDFIEQTDLEILPEYYYDAFLNYLGVTYLGSNQQAVSIVLKTLLEDNSGQYQPFNRIEKISLSNVALIDCFSSAIQAYDDIHFETTTHPCGPVLSAILALSRKQKISIKEMLNALCIGMEVEIRVATAMFSKGTGNHSGWYTTGIVGGIGVAAALSHLLQFDRNQIKNALALACNYASGTRGSHGSMAGSFVPAIACKNGFMATMLVKQGMTCSFTSLVGENGLIKQITNHPAIEKARKNLGKEYLSLYSSCKPYPYGFISFSAIALLGQMNIDKDNIEKITVEVSPRVKQLGSNAYPQTMYDAFVSLPYIIASIIIDKEKSYRPVKEDFMITDHEKRLIHKIIIQENKELQNDEIYITVNQKRYYLKDAPGSMKKPMSHEEVIDKFKKIADIKNKEQFIHEIYYHDIKDIYRFIMSYFDK